MYIVLIADLKVGPTLMLREPKLVCVQPGIQSEDQNQFFYIQSEDILTKRGQNFSPHFVTMCTVLSLS